MHQVGSVIRIIVRIAWSPQRQIIMAGCSLEVMKIAVFRNNRESLEGPPPSPVQLHLAV